MKRTFPTNPARLAKFLMEKASLSTSYASELANGARTPSYDLAIKLEADHGIPPRYWQSVKARRDEQEAAKAADKQAAA